MFDIDTENFGQTILLSELRDSTGTLMEPTSLLGYRNRVLQPIIDLPGNHLTQVFLYKNVQNINFQGVTYYSVNAKIGNGPSYNGYLPGNIDVTV